MHRTLAASAPDLWRSLRGSRPGPRDGARGPAGGIYTLTVLLLVWTAIAAWFGARDLVAAGGRPETHVLHWAAWAVLLPVVVTVVRRVGHDGLTALALSAAVLLVAHACVTAVARSVWRLTFETLVVGPHLIWLDGVLLLAFMGIAGTIGRRPDGVSSEPPMVTSVTEEPATAPSILVVRSGHRIRVAVDQIDYLQAEDNYVRLFSGGRSDLVRGPLSNCLHDLEALGFVRIHRRFAVNLARIESVGRGRRATVRLGSGVTSR